MRSPPVRFWVLFALALIYGLLFFFPPEEASEQGRALTTPFFLVTLAFFIFVTVRWLSGAHTR